MRSKTSGWAISNFGFLASLKRLGEVLRLLGVIKVFLELDSVFRLDFLDFGDLRD